jgi:hypothetical protein
MDGLSLAGVPFVVWLVVAYLCSWTVLAFVNRHCADRGSRVSIRALKDKDRPEIWGVFVFGICAAPAICVALLFFVVVLAFSASISWLFHLILPEE